MHEPIVKLCNFELVARKKRMLAALGPSGSRSKIVCTTSKYFEARLMVCGDIQSFLCYIQSTNAML